MSFAEVRPDLPLLQPSEALEATTVAYALTWNPPEGFLAQLPDLRVIFSLGAGVDHILRDRLLPAGIPIVRVVDENLCTRMCEYITLHCLMLTRQQRALDRNQRRRVWHDLVPVTVSDVRVGIMGLGVLGRAVTKKLVDFGFNVAGWSKNRKAISDVESFAGADELRAFLGRTDILVSLLPYTSETSGLIGDRVFRMLAVDGPLGGPCFISAGRGGVQKDYEILQALDNMTLRAAVLDVFEKEPLPPDHPFWGHDKVTVTPHCAAVVDPRSIVHSVADNIARIERGDQLRNVIDRVRGY